MKKLKLISLIMILVMLSGVLSFAEQGGGEINTLLKTLEVNGVDILQELHDNEIEYKLPQGVSKMPKIKAEALSSNAEVNIEHPENCNLSMELCLYKVNVSHGNDMSSYFVYISIENIETTNIKSNEFVFGDFRTVLYEGEVEEFTYELLPLNTTNKIVDLIAIDPSVLQIDGYNMKALKKGNTDVSVLSQDGSIALTFNVVVHSEEIPIEKIEFEKTEYDIDMGETIKLSGKVLPENATYKEIYYELDSNEIARLFDYNNIIGLSEGTVEVFVTVPGDSIIELIKINVSNKQYNKKPTEPEIPTENPSNPSNPTNPTNPGYVAPTSVRFTERPGEMYEGDIFKTKYYIGPESATDKKVIFTSSDSKIATVTSNGIVTAINPGSATIEVKLSIDQNVMDSFNIEVKEDNRIKRIYIDDDKVDVMIGRSHQIKYELKPSDSGDSELEWESSNDKIVKVDSTGILTPVKLGKAKITVTAKNNTDVTETITVNVIKLTQYPEMMDFTEFKSEMKVGETNKIVAKFLPEDTTEKQLNYFIEDNRIVDINKSTNEITALRYGETKIKIYSADLKQFKELSVKVEYPENHWKTVSTVFKTENFIETKDIIIKFSSKLDYKTIADNVEVNTDITGNSDAEDVVISLDSSNQNIVIKSPTDGWISGKEYYIMVRKELKSVEGIEVGQDILYTIKIRN